MAPALQRHVAHRAAGAATAAFQLAEPGDKRRLGDSFLLLVHSFTGRGEPVLCVFAPEPRDDASKDWLEPLLPATAAVYPDLGQLWRTARLLERLGRIAMPSGARGLIEGVYEPEPEATPPGLALVGNQLEGKRQANRSIGRFNALDLADGYRSQTDYWDDIHTPTRLGDARVRVRLARWQDGRLIPWSDDSRHPWPMSEVNVRENWLVREAEPSDPALLEAVETYRETVFDKGRWSKLLVPQSAHGKGWEGEAIDKLGERSRFRYDPKTGLSRLDGGGDAQPPLLSEAMRQAVDKPKPDFRTDREQPPQQKRVLTIIPSDIADAEVGCNSAAYCAGTSSLEVHSDWVAHAYFVRCSWLTQAEKPASARGRGRGRGETQTA